MSIGWAIISAGDYADSRGAPGIKQAEGGKLVAVQSRNQSRADAFAEKHGAQMAYTSVEDVLADSRIDAVYITAPNHLHVEYTKMAANAGKHVLVEKPIDITLEKADALIEACSANGVQLGVIFQLRFLDISKEVRAAVERGDLGAPVQFDCYMKFYRPQEYYSDSRWKGTQALDGGGALINQGIHGLDLLLHLVGDDVVSVQAQTAVRAHVDIEVEDTCAVSPATSSPLSLRKTVLHRALRNHVSDPC